MSKLIFLKVYKYREWILWENMKLYQMNINLTEATWNWYNTENKKDNTEENYLKHYVPITIKHIHFHQMI